MSDKSSDTPALPPTGYLLLLLLAIPKSLKVKIHHGSWIKENLDFERCQRALKSSPGARQATIEHELLFKR